MEVTKGIFYAVGVGPGDPELLTLKACRILEACPVVAAPRTRSGGMLALDIAQGAVDLTGKEILPLDLTMAVAAEGRTDAHAAAVEQIARRLTEGKHVAMAVLGDVAVYASCTPLMDRLTELGFQCVMIPGVTSFSAAAARLGVSLTEPDRPLAIVPGNVELDQYALQFPGSKVLMKSGIHLDEVRKALEEQGMLDRAALVANCGLPGELVSRNLRELPERLSYFTTIIVKE